MLATAYKTATELGLTEVERQALIKVLGALERGELKHRPYFDPWHVAGAELVAPNSFNMANLYCQDGCGTIGCMVGWAFQLSNGSAFNAFIKGRFSSVDSDPRLKRLFGIGEDRGVLQHITTEKAAMVLRAFLTTGVVHWEIG